MPEKRFGDKETVEYHLAYSMLIQAARHRGTVTYQELALLVGLPLSGNYMSNSLGWLLRNIAENEAVHKRPMLSALAVSVNGKPGTGFFPLARELGLLNSADPETEGAFWENQKRQCYELWQQQFSK